MINRAIVALLPLVPRSIVWRVSRRYIAGTTLEEALDGADIFLGLSAAGVLKPQYLEKMAAKPLILALANPVPGRVGFQQTLSCQVVRHVQDGGSDGGVGKGLEQSRKKNGQVRRW